MSYSYNAGTQYQSFVLTDFLEHDDLSTLEEKPIVAEKD